MVRAVVTGPGLGFLDFSSGYGEVGCVPADDEVTPIGSKQILYRSCPVVRLDDFALPVHRKISNIGRRYIVAMWANEADH